MKKVTLIGDSIRLGYEGAVRTELEGCAEVWAPEGNGMHSVNHLFFLSWYLEQPADLIHFNFGGWDCRRLGASRSDNAVPLEQFARNLDFILSTVRANTRAILIWATITPVIEARYNGRQSRPFDPRRVASDHERYNETALPILEKHGVALNDLHAFVTREGAEKLIDADGIHYTAEGYRLLGKKVADEIKKLL